ncbi:MAG: hypothetical protein EA424_00005, partial [Planctomycetaceae bacterium]
AYLLELRKREEPSLPTDRRFAPLAINHGHQPVLRQRPQSQQRKTRSQGTTGRIDHDTFTETQMGRFNITELVPLARGIRMESDVRAVKPQVLLNDSRPTNVNVCWLLKEGAAINDRPHVFSSNSISST